MWGCQVCSGAIRHVCSTCNLGYCSNICQKQDWSAGHQDICWNVNKFGKDRTVRIFAPDASEQIRKMFLAALDLAFPMVYFHFAKEEPATQGQPTLLIASLGESNDSATTMVRTFVNNMGGGERTQRLLNLPHIKLIGLLPGKDKPAKDLKVMRDAGIGRRRIGMKINVVFYEPATMYLDTDSDSYKTFLDTLGEWLQEPVTML